MASDIAVHASGFHRTDSGEIQTAARTKKRDAEIRLTEEEWVSRYNTDFRATIMAAEGLDRASFSPCPSVFIPAVNDILKGIGNERVMFGVFYISNARVIT